MTVNIHATIIAWRVERCLQKRACVGNAQHNFQAVSIEWFFKGIVFKHHTIGPLCDPGRAESPFRSQHH